MTSEEQIQFWVDGDSRHGAEECCPDFSCCNDKMKTPKEERETFQRADERGREAMLMTFLGRAINTIQPKKKVHLAGEPMQIN